MYNLIKRALVTIDENEKIKLYNNGEKGIDDQKKVNEPQSEENSVEFKAASSPAVSLAKEKARVIIDEAESEARQIRKTAVQIENEARHKAAQTLENAQAEIVSKEEQIKKDWEGKLKSSVEALAKMQETLSKSQNQYVEITTQKLMLIIKNLIQKVLLLSVEQNQEIILEKKVKEMVNRVISLKDIVFKFNPGDIKNIPEGLQKEMKETLTSFQIKQDRTISKGSVICETNYGTLDGTLENQMELINEMIEQIFGEV